MTECCVQLTMETHQDTWILVNRIRSSRQKIHFNNSKSLHHMGPDWLGVGVSNSSVGSLIGSDPLVFWFFFFSGRFTFSSHIWVPIRCCSLSLQTPKWKHRGQTRCLKSFQWDRTLPGNPYAQDHFILPTHSFPPKRSKPGLRRWHLWRPRVHRGTSLTKLFLT